MHEIMPFCRLQVMQEIVLLQNFKQTHFFPFCFFSFQKFKVIWLTRKTNEICHHIPNSSVGLSPLCINTFNLSVNNTLVHPRENANKNHFTHSPKQT